MNLEIITFIYMVLNCALLFASPHVYIKKCTHHNNKPQKTVNHHKTLNTTHLNSWYMKHTKGNNQI